MPWLQEALSAELEVLRTVPPTTISWSGPVPIAGYPFAAPTGGGVYIVLDVDKTPLYVGETQDFVIRWRGRLLSAYQLGFTNARGRLPRPLMVYFGRLPVAHARQKSIREAVEHVVIRALINGQLVGPQGLRNARSILTLRVKDQVSIAGLLPTDLLAKKTRPVLGLSGGKLHLRDDSRFETGGR